MIYLIAGCYWFILWLIAPEGAESSLKLNYPEIPFIDLVRERFLELLLESLTTQLDWLRD